MQIFVGFGASLMAPAPSIALSHDAAQKLFKTTLQADETLVIFENNMDFTDRPQRHAQIVRFVPQ